MPDVAAVTSPLDRIQRLTTLTRPTKDKLDIDLSGVYHMYVSTITAMLDEIVNLTLATQILPVRGTDEFEARLTNLGRLDMLTNLFVRLFPFDGERVSHIDPLAGDLAELEIYISNQRVKFRGGRLIRVV